MRKMRKGFFFLIMLAAAADAAALNLERTFDGAKAQNKLLTIGMISAGSGAMGSGAVAAKEIAGIRSNFQDIRSYRRLISFNREQAKRVEQVVGIMKSGRGKTELKSMADAYKVRLKFNREQFVHAAERIKLAKSGLLLNITAAGLKAGGIAGVTAAASMLAPVSSNPNEDLLKSLAYGVTAALGANFAWQSLGNNAFSWRGLGLSAIIGLASSTLTHSLR